jgi:hypothetical protein
MVDRTSTGIAPWTLVEANDKGYARVKVLRTICERLEAELEGKPMPHAKPEKPAKDRPAGCRPSQAAPKPAPARPSRPTGPGARPAASP